MMGFIKVLIEVYFRKKMDQKVPKNNFWPKMFLSCWQFPHNRVSLCSIYMHGVKCDLKESTGAYHKSLPEFLYANSPGLYLSPPFLETYVNMIFKQF